MPIYEYTCPSCCKVFEEWVKTHDTSPQPCPDCGTQSPHIVSNTTFVLKGSGWYVTDYGNRKGDSGKDSPSPAAPAPAAPASAASESAPASSDAAPAAPAPTSTKDASASAA